MALVAILLVVTACWGTNRAGQQVAQSLGIEAPSGRLAYVILLATFLATLRFFATDAERIWSFTAARGNILYLCLALAVLRIAWCLVRLSEHWEFLKAKLREAVWSGINAEDLKVLKDTIAWSPMSALAGRTPEFSAMNEALQSLDALASTYASLQTWASPVVSVRTIAITSPAGPARQNLRFSLMKTILEADASFLSGQSGRSPETLWGCPAFRRFEAARMLILARCVFESLRSRLIEILVLMALLSVGVLAFSFTPERAVSLFLVVVAAIIATVVIHTLREIDRNPFLSWASGGNAWTVEWTKDFLSRIVLFGLGPALLLLATQIPALARILGPFLDTLSAVGK